jgi:hypothetical protein
MPPTEEIPTQYLKIILKVSTQASFTFYVAGFSKEDIRQIACMMCLRALPRYDEERPLESFLWIHVRNRMANLARDELAVPAKRNVRLAKPIDNPQGPPPKEGVSPEYRQLLFLLHKKTPRQYRETYLRMMGGNTLKTYLKNIFIKYLYDEGLLGRLYRFWANAHNE